MDPFAEADETVIGMGRWRTFHTIRKDEL